VVIHDCEQGTLEWTKLHFGIPTASGLDNLLTPEFELRKGETPKTYLYKKVAEKLQGRPLIDLSASSFMLEQGMIVESEARPWYALEYDKHVRQVGFITTDDGRFGCSPDGLIEGEDCGLEIKSPAAHTHVKYLVNGVLPKEYTAQVLGSMFATGFKKWVFVSYRRGFPALVLEIQRDQKAMDAIARAIDSFHSEFQRAMTRIQNITKLAEAVVAA
jgi:YqaJ-like viral recombinase domain